MFHLLTAIFPKEKRKMREGNRMKKLLSFILILAMTASIGLTILAPQADVAAAGQPKASYLVVFKNNASPAAIAQSKAAIVRQNGNITHQYTNFKVIAADLTDTAVRGLQHNPNILAVEPDMILTATATEVIDWGVDRVEAPAAWNSGDPNYKGLGINVGIIDTGISQHEDLTIAGGVNCINANSSYYDDNGHGTHVAGTIGAINNTYGVVGVAPEASLYSIKVLNSRGSGTLSDVAEGIDWAIKSSQDHPKMDIINMSLGASSGSSTLQTAVEAADNAGLLIVCAAGNSGTTAGTGDSVGYPAKYVQTIAVAATDKNNIRAYFSSTGPDVDVAAPGYNIYSTYLGTSAYATLSGTSMAAPHVAGVLAVLLEEERRTHADINNHELRLILENSARDLGEPGVDNWYGHGLVSANIVNGPTQIVPTTTALTPLNEIYKRSSTSIIAMTVTVLGPKNVPIANAAVKLTLILPNRSSTTTTVQTGSNGQVTWKYPVSKRTALGLYKLTAVTSPGPTYLGSSTDTTFTIN
jgi:minor extracellular protease Epr